MWSRTVALGAQARAVRTRTLSTFKAGQSSRVFEGNPSERWVAGSTPDGQLRCSEIDSQGRVIAEETIVPRAAFLERFRLQPRDGRKLDGSALSQGSALLVRPRCGCILVRLPRIRAVVTPDTVVLCKPPRPRTEESVELRRQFLGELQRVLREHCETQQQLPPSTASKDEYPFELAALEPMLEYAVFRLGRDLAHMRTEVERVLKTARDVITPEALSDLLELGRHLAALRAEVADVRQAIASTLNSDQDLAGMYLSDSRAGRPRALDDHDEAEVMLETYLRSTDEVSTAVEQLVAHKQLTEGIMNIQLQHERNSLSRLELAVAIVVAGLTLGSFGAALFGMNLRSHFENEPYMFYVVSGTLLALAMFTMGLLRRRQMQAYRTIRCGPRGVRR